MTVVVTGGAGFLGFHLSKRLAEAGREVVIVDNFSRGARDQDLEDLIQRPNVQVLDADLENPDALTSLGDVEAVFHLAAVIGVRHVMEDPARVLRVNARTVLNVADFIAEREVPWSFFSSTSEAYAWSAKVMDIAVPTPEDVPLAVDEVNNRRASYALSKIFGEMIFTHRFSGEGPVVAMGRLHNVYGPRMGTAHVVPELFTRMRATDGIISVPEASATRAFCYVDDALDAIDLLMTERSSGVFNVGNQDEEVSIGRVAELVAEYCGLGSDRVAADFDSAPAIPRRCPDMGRLAALGYAPRVPLDVGIQRTLDWYSTRELPAGI